MSCCCWSSSEISFLLLGIIRFLKCMQTLTLFEPHQQCSATCWNEWALCMLCFSKPARGTSKKKSVLVRFLESCSFQATLKKTTLVTSSVFCLVICLNWILTVFYSPATSLSFQLCQMPLVLFNVISSLLFSETCRWLTLNLTSSLTCLRPQRLEESVK